MQKIRDLNVNKTDLAWLFHTSESKIDRWVKDGLKPCLDGKFLLSRVIQWRETQHKQQLETAATSRLLSQQQLAKLFGVSRQTVSRWGRSGLPRRANNRYDLQAVCLWLRGYYQSLAATVYKKRIRALQKKIRRNLAQCQRFVSGDNVNCGQNNSIIKETKC